MKISRMARRGVTALGVAFVILVVAGIAPATPGNGGGNGNGKGALRIPLGNVPFDLDASVCGFPIHSDVVKDKEYLIHETTLADGTVIDRITGSLVSSFTNLNTGKTIVENVSGPGNFIAYPDGTFLFDAQGQSFIVLGPTEQANTGEPGLIFTSGHADLFFDATGTAVSFTLSGNQTDGCALLS